MFAILDTLGWVTLPILLVVFASTELVVLINDFAAPVETADSIAQRASAEVRSHHAATAPPLPLQRTRTRPAPVAPVCVRTDPASHTRPPAGSSRQPLTVS